MTKTELMVLPQHPVVKHDHNAVAEYEVPDDDFDPAQYSAETYAEILEEAEALELRFGADSERCDKLMKKFTQDNAELIAQINTVQAEMIRLQLEMEESDDLEDKANAEDLNKILGEAFSEEDTDKRTQEKMRQSDVKESLERMNLRKLEAKCRKIYKQIAKMTHPDKCRSLSEAQREERKQMFLLAKTALLRKDIDALCVIYEKVFGKSFDTPNLIERLIQARLKRDRLAKQLADLYTSPEWSLYCLALHHGRGVAGEQFRLNLEQTLRGLKAVLASIKGDDSDSDSTNYHWV